MYKKACITLVLTLLTLSGCESREEEMKDWCITSSEELDRINECLDTIPNCSVDARYYSDVKRRIDNYCAY